jgi:GNAT superfamily N-acetyltransferase
MTQEWTIRPAVGNDLAFIYSCWLNSYRSDSHIGSTCRKSVYYDSYNQVIDRILDEAYTLVRVAVDPNDENVIYGYAVYDPSTIHYVFVKEAFRELGIAASLLEHALKTTTEYSHRTRCVAELLNEHRELTYNPFSLFKKLTINPGEENAQSIS